MKIISQLDERGYFVGPAVADESPLEPGVYLYPAGTVDAPPPSLIPTGTRAYWSFEADDWAFASEEPDTPPPPPAPTEEEVLQQWRESAVITMRQCRLHLFATGKLNLVDAAITALPSPHREVAEIEWEYGAVVLRSSPLIAQLAPVLGWGTPEEIDAQFIAASQL